jgi:hypothetical protein
MSAEYQKGRYDELVERHKELIEMYKNLQWTAMMNVPRAGVSGAEVHYYGGVKFDTRAIGATIGGTGIAFSLMTFAIGLVPLTFGISFAVFGVLFGLTSYLRRETKETSNPQLPPAPLPHQT